VRARGSVMSGGADLDAGVRSACGRADGDAICALVRCADWQARRVAVGDGPRPCDGQECAAIWRRGLLVEAVSSRG
jgi:hypothetical protein